MGRCLSCDIDGLSLNKDKICEECNDKIEVERRKITGKPPLGLMSKRFWNGRRMQDISEAMNRYIQENIIIPIEWIEEYNKLVEEINSE